MNHLQSRKLRFLVLRDHIPLYGCTSCRFFRFDCDGCVNHALKQKMVAWRIETFGWHDAADWLQRKYY